MNTKRLFYNWLQKENCLKQFKHNVKRCVIPDHLMRYYSFDGPDFFLSSAFLWDASNEGHHYWLCKDNKWCKFLEDKYPNLIN